MDGDDHDRPGGDPRYIECEHHDVADVLGHPDLLISPPPTIMPVLKRGRKSLARNQRNMRYIPARSIIPSATRRDICLLD